MKTLIQCLVFAIGYGQNVNTYPPETRPYELYNVVIFPWSHASATAGA